MHADAGVEVRDSGERGRGVFALRAFAMGEVVVRGRVVGVSARRHAHSIQVDWDRHVEMDAPAVLLNHACQPTVGVRDNAAGAYDFVALVAIATGDEITFDYAMTEHDIAAAAECRCGAEGCRGTLRGFAEVGAEVRARYGGFIARYLRDGAG